MNHEFGPTDMSRVVDPLGFIIRPSLRIALHHAVFGAKDTPTSHMVFSLHDTVAQARDWRTKHANGVAGSAWLDPENPGGGFSQTEANRSAANWRQAKIKKLKVSTVYSEHGSGASEFEHGKNDGYHGSKRKRIGS